MCFFPEDGSYLVFKDSELVKRIMESYIINHISAIGRVYRGKMPVSQSMSSMCYAGAFCFNKQLLALRSCGSAT